MANEMESQARKTCTSIFDAATYILPDAIFALTEEYHKDRYPKKVNLGQGTYRDAFGNPWVLPSVQTGREKLASQGLNHEYLPILGHEKFRLEATKLALGDQLFASLRDQVAVCQSVSGTGALHLAGLLLRRGCKERPTVIIPTPTWSNHRQVFSSLGFDCHPFSYYDEAKKRIDWECYLDTLKRARSGSVVILHACAHNPTGFDPTREKWIEIGCVVKNRGLFPLFDAAYLGFNSGSIDDDAFSIRHFTALGIEVGVCLSFAKNMGLYGERVGCLFIVSQNVAIARNVQSVLEMLQRSEISNPPAYGSKIVATILEDEALRRMWYEDLRTMSLRIKSMRQALYEHLIQAGAPGLWEHLIQQTGMFGFLGLPLETVNRLKERHHIYMASNSRISIAGLNPNNVQYVAESIAKCLKSSTI
ncbi:aromatic-amino-acid aminotransferase [Penicillium daleae]|uniref:Aspartate aminotransferase n=1 Tax=Penicillium daleae TaxID=63821 RepID=A0AAD6FXQ2_9EURO|nr:aromatic-amino-acid aminotransferase [Penicillium daleae]KAJ5433663.1 aromatic-amino-acid aminotransferase [Penicillium daleae]